MKYPYLISSDQHLHGWSQFSTVDADGINSRLTLILGEIEGAYETLLTEGGDTAFLAGDLLHVRGHIKPSVFNPMINSFASIHMSEQVTTHAIPGNHDLEGKDTTALGNAMQALDEIPYFNVCIEPKIIGDVVVFPWHQDLDALRKAMKKHARKTRDAIIHAPVNGVIKGIPNHGLEADELAAMGYRRVFAGHYHDHKSLCDGKVFSIGATTHQTWSDVGTTAGFMLVYPDSVVHVESKAPKFMDLAEASDAAADAGCTVEEMIAGNYIRVRLEEASENEIKKWRTDIIDAGALGVNIIATKKATTGRSGSGAKAALSLAASVEHYIRTDFRPLHIDKVSQEAERVLREATR
jgi:DNA repair exonuclease SbcCD nuclease subunit